MAARTATRRKPRRVPSGMGRETAGERRARLDKVAPLPAPPFNARAAMRQAGFQRTGDLRTTAERGRDIAGRASRWAKSDPTLRPYHPASFAELAVFAAASLLGLALLDTALRGRGPAGVEALLGGLATGIRRLFDPRDTLVRKGEAEPFVPPALGDIGPRPDEGTRGATAARGGAWGGSKAVVDGLTRVLGLTTSSEKRPTRNTASGGVSDHWTGSRNAFARDLSGSVAAMDAAAVVLARLLGVRGYRKGQPLVVTVNRAGYRVQVLYRTMIGGNHFDHIHVGARRL